MVHLAGVDPTNIFARESAVYPIDVIRDLRHAILPVVVILLALQVFNVPVYWRCLVGEHAQNAVPIVLVDLAC